MKTHPITINIKDPGYDMGVELAKLRYDILLETLTGIQEELANQSEGDKNRGRIKLSNKLIEVSNSLKQVVEICKPYIEKEKNTK